MLKNYLAELITKNVEDGIILINNSLDIEVFNPIASRFVGISESEAVGKKIDEVIKVEEDGKKTIFDRIEETMTGHETTLYHKAVIECEEDVKIPIIYRLIPTESGCLIIFRDYVLRYKTDFLSLLAHQLKTPLGSMRWNLEEVLNSQLAKNDLRLSELITDVYNCNSRMTLLVDDLLNASKIDARKVPNSPINTNILETIGMAIKELSYQIKDKEVMVKVFNKDASEILIDYKHFREVIQNLLSNAIKYNKPKGEVNITVEQKNSEVSITIGDTGIGINNSDLSKVFSKSFRAKNAIETQIDGSGLGLYVAKSYIEDWGGTITCNSEIGKGTTFVLTIPLTIPISKLDDNLVI